MTSVLKPPRLEWWYEIIQSRILEWTTNKLLGDETSLNHFFSKLLMGIEILQFRKSFQSLFFLALGVSGKKLYPKKWQTILIYGVFLFGKTNQRSGSKSPFLLQSESDPWSVLSVTKKCHQKMTGFFDPSKLGGFFLEQKGVQQIHPKLKWGIFVS